MSEIKFCDVDPKKTEDNIIAIYEALAKRKLAAADPIYIFLKGLAYFITHQNNVINETGKQNLLRYATEANLDRLADLVNVKRLQASPALVTCRFTRAKGSTAAILIPAGVRVTADSKIFFSVVSNIFLNVVQDSVDVTCRAMVAGSVANDIKIGDINKIVDPVSYLAGVSNVTISSGGADIESDESFRERVRTAPEKFSVAGPIEAYRSLAKEVNQTIVDVAVFSPAAGLVNIAPLLVGGELPSKEILDAVYEKLNDKRVRPLTDKVSVLAPEVVEYNIDLKYYLYSNSIVSDSSIKNAVEDYILWQKSQLGRDINPTELIYRLKSVGIKRIELMEPSFITVEENEVALAKSVSFVLGGVENE